MFILCYFIVFGCGYKVGILVYWIVFKNFDVMEILLLVGSLIFDKNCLRFIILNFLYFLILLGSDFMLLKMIIVYWVWCFIKIDIIILFEMLICLLLNRIKNIIISV